MAETNIIHIASENSDSPTNAIITTTKTTCPYCGVGCGVLASHNSDTGEVTIQGDPEHPANYGRLCSKGSALGETLETGHRISHPVINGEKHNWDATLDHIASTMRETIDRHGPDSVMFYVSGQLLTEDYYVANKLIKGFIGNNNIDSNSRLCMSSAVAGYKRAFGSDTVPTCYEDIEASELFVICGSNMAWCHPVLFQRLKAAQAKDNKKVVVIDPRATDSCAIANLHLPIKPGTDTILFNGLFAYLSNNDCLDENYLEVCDGFDSANEQAQHFSNIEQVAQLCDVNVEALTQFYQWFAATEKVVSFYSMGVNQSTSGTDKVNSIINCHAITGKIGKLGAGPFSITGQPNAMGGREVGALANLLAAHFDLNKDQHRQQVQEFWQAPQVIQADTGVTAARAAKAILDGKIKFIWIMATNPVVSLPEANNFAKALQACPHVIVSDNSWQSDTTKFADVVLPAQGWSERDGTVTNSERCVSRQRKFMTPFEQAKPDWWILSQVAQRMGYAGFKYETSFDVFKEHAALSGYQNQGSRSFDLSALQSISREAFDTLMPQQWPISTTQNNAKRFFSEGNSFHDSSKIMLIPIEPRQPQSQLSDEYPLALNTGRVRDQWHTMTRTGLSARLNQHLPEPFLSVHSDDAQSLNIENGKWVRAQSIHGAIVVRADVSDKQRKGEVFSPMHWSNHFASNARVGQLIAANVDPTSLQPEFKYTPVNIQAVKMQWHGKCFFRVDKVSDEYWHCFSHADYWAMNQQNNSKEFYVAGESKMDVAALEKSLLEVAAEGVKIVKYSDPSKQHFRCVAYDEIGIIAAIYVCQEDFALPASNWIRNCFADYQQQREANGKYFYQWLLAGQPPDGDFDIGNIVCSCFTVGDKVIEKAIAEKGCQSVASIGELLKAGTNCGSCVPEIAKIIERSVKK